MGAGGDRLQGRATMGREAGSHDVVFSWVVGDASFLERPGVGARPLSSLRAAAVAFAWRGGTPTGGRPGRATMSREAGSHDASFSFVVGDASFLERPGVGARPLSSLRAAAVLPPPPRLPDELDESDEGRRDRGDRGCGFEWIHGTHLPPACPGSVKRPSALLRLRLRALCALSAVGFLQGRRQRLRWRSRGGAAGQPGDGRGVLRWGAKPDPTMTSLAWSWGTLRTSGVGSPYPTPCVSSRGGGASTTAAPSR